MSAERGAVDVRWFGLGRVSAERGPVGEGQILGFGPFTVHDLKCVMGLRCAMAYYRERKRLYHGDKLTIHYI